jgi:hypothetical protein
MECAPLAIAAPRYVTTEACENVHAVDKPTAGGDA